jgi:uncharacterized protein
MLQLRFLRGPQSGEPLRITKSRFSFGRANTSDCVLNHRTVSREHFYIEHNAGKYFVVDQGSNNGTLVNGVKVSWVELKQGDQIQAGPFSFTVELAAADTGAGPAPTAGSMSVGEQDSVELRSSALLSIYPREYLKGIEHFNAGRYFEAHEIWEEIWMRSSGDSKLFYQMLIQAAVGFHHYFRGNVRGARGMYTGVTAKLPKLPTEFMGLDVTEFGRRFKTFFAELMAQDADVVQPADKSIPRIELLR